MELKNSWCLVLLAGYCLSIGMSGCVKQPLEMLILPCPIPTKEAIESLNFDEVPYPIVEYLKDLDVYCGMIDSFKE